MQLRAAAHVLVPSSMLRACMLHVHACYLHACYVRQAELACLLLPHRKVSSMQLTVESQTYTRDECLALRSLRELLEQTLAGTEEALRNVGCCC